MGLLESWAILDKAQILSNYKAIISEYQEAQLGLAREAQKERSKVTGWKINALLGEKKEKM